MKTLFCLVPIFIFSVFYHQKVIAQGCSDAGFCSLGALRPNQPYHKQQNLKLRSINFTQYYAYNDFYDHIWSWTVDLNFSLGKKISAQLKLPYYYIDGVLASTQGLSDVSMAFSRSLWSDENGNQIALTLGTKLPTNTSDLRTKEGRPLPMYYQTSLGTYDFIVGASYSNRKWLLATGLQQPVLHDNRNQFLWGAWTGSPAKPISDTYARSKELRRSAEVMGRIERNFRFSRLNFYTGLLGIWKLHDDTFLNPQGKRIAAEGSHGLVLNTISGVGYAFSTQSSLKFLVGYRVMGRRQAHIDGLKRELVLTLTYDYRF